MGQKKHTKTTSITKIPQSKKSQRSKKTFNLTTISLVLITVFIGIITIYKIVELFTSNNAENTQTLPKLEISLSEVPLEEINLNSKDIKYLGNTAALTINEQTTIFNNIEIKGHGNSTWIQPKKPYQIKLAEKTSLFNFKEAKKWLLLANYIDPTHLRNDIAFYIEKLLNEPYALNGNFLEIYFNGIYNGLYYLTEKIEIKKSRINLDDKYGIVVEFNNVYDSTEEVCHYDIFKNCLVISDTTNPDNQSISITLFIDDFNNTQSAIKQQDFSTIKNLIDIDSFVKYYLLSEFTVDPDAYSTSFYLYKNGENDKIHAGPGWDFDFALGNLGWTPAPISNTAIHSPFETTPLKSFIINNPSKEDFEINPISTLFYDLMDIPEFEARVKEIYQSTLSGKKEELLNYIRSQANYIRNAALRDQERWKLKTNFDDEVNYLIDWVSKRYDHFEQTYGINSAIEEHDSGSKPDSNPEPNLNPNSNSNPDPSSESSLDPTPESLPPSTE